MTRHVLTLLALVGIAVAAVVPAVASPGNVSPGPRVLVTVTAEGGMCAPTACRWSGRITTTTISATGRRSRPLAAAERRALVAAIAALRPASLPRFKGTCPIAYDGQERIYRFSGKPVLRSCTVELGRVRAVKLADRLLTSLRAQ